MDAPVNPDLTKQDLIVLKSLLHDIATSNPSASSLEQTNITADRTAHDTAAIDQLAAINDPTSTSFDPTVTTTWDNPDLSAKFSPLLRQYVLTPYIRWARTVVRRETDVVFLTHTIFYFCTSVPSAIILYTRFNILHGIFHLILIAWSIGAFTLMLHNHIHNNGVLSKPYALFDKTFPYVLGPLMGHTWNSYYFHHCKMHHVEGNGPNDLSSTIRYQRDSVSHLLMYIGRFYFFIWAELPLYFLRTGKTKLALKSFVSEISSYLFVYGMAKWQFQPTLWVLILPLAALRVGLMVGNWGQHALVDEEEPDSDFRSSITLIDVPSNRYSFNDGYHTAHHLNPRRHWRDQPLHFLRSKEAYTSGRALVFQNIDYIFMTITLARKDYATLADCLVPIGEEQISMSKSEIAEMLKRKTRAFSEEDIARKFGGGNTVAGKKEE